MSTNKTNTVLGKVSQSATIALNKAGNDFDKAAKTLSATVQKIEELPNTIQAMLQEIAETEARLSELKAETEREVNSAALDLKEQIRENEDAVFAKMLKDRGLVTTTQAELDTAEAKLARADEELEAAVAEATNKLKGVLTSAHTQAMKVKELEHEAATATTNAKLENAEGRVADLERQVADLKEQLAAELQARVQVETARANSQSVVVNTDGNKR